MQGLQLVVTLAASAVKFTPPPDNKYHIKKNAERHYYYVREKIHLTSCCYVVHVDVYVQK